jgi:hypothetical protein
VTSSVAARLSAAARAAAAAASAPTGCSSLVIGVPFSA